MRLRSTRLSLESWPRRRGLPLDFLPFAAAAHSLRLVRSNYTGAAIVGRRSTDNDETLIGLNANGDLDTARLLDFAGGGSVFVPTWYDQSVFARHAIQPNPALQPRIVDAGAVDMVNGKPAIYFDGTGKTLTTERLLSVLQNSIVNYVGTSGRDGSTPYSLNGNEGFARYSLHAPESGLFRADLGSPVPPGRLNATFPYAYSEAHIFSSINTNVRQVRGNGSVLATGTVMSGGLAQGTAQIGATLFPGIYLYLGHLCEFSVFDQFVDEGDVSALERNQGFYYGITTP